MHFNKKLVSGLGGIIAVSGLASLLIVTGQKKEAQKEADATKVNLNASPRPITLGRVKEESTVQQRNYPGVVKASDESSLSFRVGGPLINVNANPGMPVKKGALLMKIDPRDFNDQVQTIKARLAGAIALQKKAQQDYDRANELFEGKVIPKSDFDRDLSSRDSADASVKELKAKLMIARHALADTSLRAPFDGAVTTQLVENYEIVNPNTTVLHFHNIQQLEVTVNVPENEMAHSMLSPETSAQVEFPALDGKSYTATLKEWSTNADPLTRTYAITFEFAAPTDCKILPGMSADIVWQQNAELALVVPVSALNIAADGTHFIWVYNDGKAEKRSVKTGPLQGTDQIIIRQGLKKGEQMVISGSRLIQPNQALTVANQS